MYPNVPMTRVDMWDCAVSFSLASPKSATCKELIKCSAKKKLTLYMNTVLL